MALKVLIVPDKFKGTLTASQAAQAMARGWSQARPNDQITCQPMSDGGDGFGIVISELLQARSVQVAAVDAAHRPCQVRFGFEEASKTAVIESAGVIGLAMLPPRQFHPFDLDTEGLGQVLRAAANLGARKFLVGIGGSATNDAGMGMARALGWRFQDQSSREITQWTGLDTLAKVHPPPGPLALGEVTVAVDVQNPLLGSQGCSRVYGVQKGLGPADLDRAERCLAKLATVLETEFKRDVAKMPGAGAAGGLGFGLVSFCSAHLQPGFDIFARLARLEEQVELADLVLTAEGALDAQTLMGKGVGEIALLCRKHGVPCLGLAGVVAHALEGKSTFTATHAMSPHFASREESMARPAEVLERLSRQVGADWRANGLASG